MKKLLVLLSSLVILSASNLFADDWVVPPSALPQKAASFIQRVFPEAQIWKV